MRINSLRITLHSPTCAMCEEFSLLSQHMRRRVPYWGVSPLFFAGGEGAVDDVLEVGVYPAA